MIVSIKMRKFKEIILARMLKIGIDRDQIIETKNNFIKIGSKMGINNTKNNTITSIMIRKIS